MSQITVENIRTTLRIGTFLKNVQIQPESVKCVQSESGFRYVKYTSLLLEELEIEHPVLQYVVRASQDFCKRYGPGMTDAFLFFIQLWLRAVETCADMGIPLSVIISSMREILNDCIKQVENTKISVKSLIELNITEKEYNQQEVIDSFTNTVENLHTNRSKVSVSLISDASAETNETLADDKTLPGSRDHASLVPTHETNTKLVENKPYEILSNRTSDASVAVNKDCANEKGVNDDGIEVIHLQMKNIPFKDESNDISWFFERDEHSESGSKSPVHDSLRVVDETLVRDSGYDEDVSEYNDKVAGKSDEIIEDIKQLKLEIESDLRKMMERKEMMHQKVMAMKPCSKNRGKIAPDEDEFDSCFDNSDSEFDDCFDERDTICPTSVGASTGGIDWKHAASKEMEAAMREFKPVELTFSAQEKPAAAENKFTSKLDKKLLLKMQESHIEKLMSVDLHKSENIDVEIRNCKNDFLKTKELLSTFQSCRNLESKCADSSGCQDVKEKCIAREKIVLTKQSKKLSIPESSHSTQISEIDKLLKSVGKTATKKDPSSPRPNFRLKSRHLQNMNEDISLSDCSTKLTTQHYEQKMNEDIPQSNCSAQELTQHGKSALESEKAKINCNKSATRQLVQHSLLTSAVSSDPNSRPLTASQTSPLQAGNKSMELNKMNSLLSNLTASTKVGLTGVGTEVRSTEIKLRSRHLNTVGSSEELLCSDVRTKENMKRSEHQNHQCAAESSKIAANQKDNRVPFKSSDRQNTEISYKNMHDLDMSQWKVGTEDVEESGMNCMYTERNKQETSVDDSGYNHVRDIVSRLITRREDLVDAVAEVVFQQSKPGELRLHLGTVRVHGRIGSCARPKVIKGVIVEVSADKISSGQPTDGKLYRALLVNGDLTESYHHKGYKPLKFKETMTVEEFVQGSSKADMWSQDLVCVLNELSVNMMLVKGRCAASIEQMLTSHDVLVIGSVPYSLLECLSEAAKINMVTYPALATQEHVCKNVSVTALQENWIDRMGRPEVVISLKGDNPQTIVLSELTHVLVDLREQELWDGLHRVNSALHCGYLLPGAGMTDKACCSFLMQQIDALKQDKRCVTNTASQYRLMVLETVLSSFREYIDCNSCNCIETQNLMESLDSKIYSWKSALDVVTVVANMDAFIVTGMLEEQCDTRTL